MRFKTLSFTKDNGDPVIRGTMGESKIIFILDTEGKSVNVWYVDSEEEGDMKLMLDEIIGNLPTNKVLFLSPFSKEDKKIINMAYDQMKLPDQLKFDVGDESKHLEDKVEGFEKRVIETSEGEIEVLEGHWWPDDYSGETGV